jgi:hypothetical protein
MKMVHWKRHFFDKYYHLLAMLLIGLFVTALMSTKGHTRYPIAPCMYVIAILFALRAAEIKRPIFIFAFILGFSVVAFDFMLLQNFEVSTALIQEIPFLIYAVFFLLAIILLITKMFSAKEVTGDTIIGGICVYLLLGFLWTVFYSAVYIVDRQAFNFSVPLNHYSFIHFSLITMTTVGYGDIQPASRLAMLLSNIEAVTGQMYVAIFILRLVSLHGKALTKNVL